MKNLSVLNVSYNQIENLEIEIFSVKLVRFDIKSNPFVTIPY